MCNAVSALLAVDHYLVYVITLLGRAVTLNCNVALWCTDAHLVEYRACNCVIRFSRTVGVEAYHREYSPSRHCSSVVVTGNAVGRVAIVGIASKARGENAYTIIDVNGDADAAVANIAALESVYRAYKI